MNEKPLVNKKYLLEKFPRKGGWTYTVISEIPMIKSNIITNLNHSFLQSKKKKTLFLQLCDQFMIRRNYAKSFDGFKNEILFKIMALTEIQLINKIIEI